MIVEASGYSSSESNVCSRATKIVSTTGTAYVKNSKIKAIIRFIRKAKFIVKNIFVKIFDIFVEKINTRSGRPSSVAPPLKSIAG